MKVGIGLNKANQHLNEGFGVASWTLREQLKVMCNVNNWQVTKVCIFERKTHRYLTRHLNKCA